MIGTLIKLLIYLVILAGIALVIYAYVGPWLDPAFSPAPTEQRETITLPLDGEG